MGFFCVSWELGILGIYSCNREPYSSRAACGFDECRGDEAEFVELCERGVDTAAWDVVGGQALPDIGSALSGLSGGSQDGEDAVGEGVADLVTEDVACRGLAEPAAKYGLLGAITARAEAQTIRLALVYALLDRAAQIDVIHLDVWR